MDNQDVKVYDEAVAKIDAKLITDMIKNIERLVGDTFVSEQIAIALESKADRNHTHDCVSISEFNALKKQVAMLVHLVGDTSVSEQINRALKK